MTQDPYSEAVRLRFADPAHAGALDDGVRVLVESQGVRVELSAAVSDARLETLRFRAWACPHLIAAAEAFCAAFEGRDVAELESFSGAPISENLDIPVQKAGRILVLEDAVRSLYAALTGARQE